MPVNPKNNSINTNNPAANKRNVIITISLLGGVHAIFSHLISKLNLVSKKNNWKI